MEFLGFEGVGIMEVLLVVLVFRVGQGWVIKARQSEIRARQNE